MVRKLIARQMIFCPEVTQYVSTSRCLTCTSYGGTTSDGVECNFEDKSSMRVMLDEDSRNI